MWQPVGEFANKFRQMIEKFIRSGNYVRLSDEWKNVSNQGKEYIWDTLMVYLVKYYYIYNSCVCICFVKYIICWLT